MMPYMKRYIDNLLHFGYGVVRHDVECPQCGELNVIQQDDDLPSDFVCMDCCHFFDVDDLITDDEPTPPNDGDPLWRMYERGELFGGDDDA